MATSSITKDFVIKDKKVYEKFIENFNNISKTLYYSKFRKSKTSYFEKGQKALKDFSVF